MDNRKICFYPHAKKVSDYKVINISDAYEMTTSREIIQRTDYILQKHKEGLEDGWRNFDKTDYREDKLLLPVVSYSTSDNRAGDNIITPESHTGLINLDIDENTKEELDKFAEQIIITLPYVEFCALSVSGEITGYRSVNVKIEIPLTYDEMPEHLKKGIKEKSWLDKLHKLYHRHISDLFFKEHGINVGSAKDLKRLRTIAYDENFYHNPSATEIKMEELVIPELKTSNKLSSHYTGTSKPEKIMDWVISKSGIPEEGHRTEKYTTYFGICNVRGISLEDAVEYVSQYGGDYEKTGKDIYDRYSSDHGTFKTNLTDMENAEQLARMYKDTIRYCFSKKKWYLYNGKNWGIDDTGQIYSLAKFYIKSVLSSSDEDGKKLKVLQSKSKIDNMIKLTQPEVPITTSEFDTNDWKLNLANGSFNLKTLEIEGYNSEDYHSKISEVEYDTEAKAPLWINFLNQIFEEDHEIINFVQKAVGYSLTGCTDEQVLFILHGHGANGKSTFINVIQALLGDYAQQMPASSLLTKKNESIPNDIARLNGARFVAASETDEGKKLSESLVKQLTGQDKITARFLNEEFFEFIPTHKIFLATNHKPNISGNDYALWRRIRLIPFDVTILPEAQDKQLTKKLIDELPGILNWAVEGLKKWQNEELEAPEKVLKATSSYREEMDVIESFIKDCCKVGDDEQILSSYLYEYYKKWAELNGERDLNQKVFSQKMQEKGYKKSRKSAGYFWIGISMDAKKIANNQKLVIS